MKKFLLVMLMLFVFTIPTLAQVELLYYTQTSISVEGLEPGEYEQKIIDEYEALHPEVKINLEVIPYAGDQGKIELSIAGGNPPDILADDVTRMQIYADAGLLIPFDLTKEELSKFKPIAIETSTYNDKMYYYPMGVRGGSFMVSKSMAERLGVLDMIPLEGNRLFTAEQLREIIAKVDETSEEGDYAWCINFADTAAYDHHLMQLIAGFGGEVFEVVDGEYKCIVNSPETKEGIQFYLDMINNYPNAIPQHPETVTIVDLDNLWTSGHLMFCPGSVNQVIKEIEGEMNIGFGLSLFPYPAKEGIRPRVPVDWCGYMVFDTGSQVKAEWAKDFVKYFVANAPDLAGANMNTTPVHEDMPIPVTFEKYMDNEEIKFALTELSQYAGDLTGACPLSSDFKELFRVNMQGVLIGEITLDECLQIVEDETNKLLEEFYSE